MNCPKCGTDCDRDEVDVGVGVMYGPYGCCACGWSEDSHYDRSDGPSPAQLEHPGHFVDPCGRAHHLGRLADRLKHFGLDGDSLAAQVFSAAESPAKKS